MIVHWVDALPLVNKIVHMVCIYTPCWEVLLEVLSHDVVGVVTSLWGCGTDPVVGVVCWDTGTRYCPILYTCRVELVLTNYENGDCTPDMATEYGYKN